MKKDSQVEIRSGLIKGKGGEKKDKKPTTNNKTTKAMQKQKETIILYFPSASDFQPGKAGPQYALGFLVKMDAFMTRVPSIVWQTVTLALPSSWHTLSVFLHLYRVKFKFIEGNLRGYGPCHHDHAASGRIPYWYL